MAKLFFALLLLALLIPPPVSFSQEKKAAAALPTEFLKRTTTRRETRRFNYGGTVTVIGAPRGSVTIEGWPRNEVELIADVELNGLTDADLDQLAKVNTFVFATWTNSQKSTRSFLTKT